MKKIVSLCASLAGLLLLSGCGGSDSTTGSGSTSTGVFVDAPVAKLTFQCSPSGQTGSTDTLGHYQYVPGDTCSFEAGGIPLGSVTAKKIVTPKDLFNAIDFNDSRVVSVAALLWILDADRNVSNGIDINITLAQSIADDLNVTKPEDLFDDKDNDGSPDIINKLNDINATLASDLNTTLQRSDEIIRHLEESELEAEYLYGNANEINVDRAMFANKRFMIGDANVTFDGNGTLHLVGFDENGTISKEENGTWTIMGNQLVLNFKGDTAYARVITYDSDQNKTQYVAFTADEVEGKVATFMDDTTASGATLDFTPQAIQYSDIANKKIVSSDVNVSFYPDGRYLEEGVNDDNTTYTFSGSWTVADNYIVIIGRENNVSGAVVNDAYAAFDSNGSKFYAFSEDGVFDKNMSLDDLQDLNDSSTMLPIDDRVTLTKEYFSNKKFTAADANVTVTLCENGSMKVIDGDGTFQGSWTLVDNYLVVVGHDENNESDRGIGYVAFTNIDNNSADAIMFDDSNETKSVMTFSITNTTCDE